ncbi:MAG: D-ribose pyranase [Clostridia bacterium]|nr:D-ribose pyranase [Clostridia bacterium]
MKNTGIQNGEISRLLAAIGHTQYIVISDVGLPIPKGVPCIDLAVRVGLPSFDDVLEAVSKELVYEAIVLATELKERFPKDCREIVSKLNKVEEKYVPHEEFKELSKNAVAIIRTGENKPYRNIILRAGVNF